VKQPHSTWGHMGFDPKDALGTGWITTNLYTHAPHSQPVSVSAPNSGAKTHDAKLYLCPSHPKEVGN
jgi:hypothetical protein